jgi:hypothetical protein
MLYCVTEFSNAEIADLIWKVQLLKICNQRRNAPHSVHQSSGRSSSFKIAEIVARRALARSLRPKTFMMRVRRLCRGASCQAAYYSE